MVVLFMFSVILVLVFIDFNLTLDLTTAHVILECPLHHAAEDTIHCCPWMMRHDVDSTASSSTSEGDLPRKRKAGFSTY